MLSRLLILAACLLLGAGAGYFWGLSVSGVSSVSADRSEEISPPHGDGMNLPEATRSKVETEQVLGTEGIPLVATLAETASIRSEFLQSAALYQLAAPLSADGIRALLDDAKSALVGGDYVGGTSLLIGRYAELDFVGALDYALAKGGPALTNWLQSIFHARARIDIDSALERAQQLSASQQRIAGIAMLRSNDNLTTQQRRLIAQTLNIPSNMVAVAQRDSSEAWAEASAIDNPMQRVSTQAQVLMSWARTDPWAAMAASDEIDNAQMKQSIQGPLLALAAADDSQRALDWLNAQPEGQQRDQLTAALVAQLGQSDPEQAQALLERLPEEQRTAAEAGLWMHKAATDPEGAAEWVARAASGEGANSLSLRGRMLPMQILSILGMASPESAERFMNALPVEQRSGLESTYVQAVSRQDPVAAANWIERQPGDVSAPLYRNLGMSWSQRSVAAAEEYAQGMSAGPNRDQMYTGILTSGRVTSEQVDAMVEQIDDQKLRAEAEQMQELLRNTRAGALSGAASSMMQLISSGGVQPATGKNRE